MVPLNGAELLALASSLLLPFLRVAALFSSAPLLSHRAIPQRVRLAAALAIAVCVASSGASVPPSSSQLIGAAVEQILVGLAIGFAMQLVFAGVSLAGDLAGMQMGLGFATVFDPQAQGQEPVLGAYMQTAALLVFLAIDGHLVLVGSVAESFRDLPPGALIARLDGMAFAKAGATVFATGLQIALPVLAGLLLVNISLAMVARVAPQLNLFSIGFPSTLLAGMGLLIVTAPSWLGGIENALRASLTAFLR